MIITPMTLIGLSSRMFRPEPHGPPCRRRQRDRANQAEPWSQASIASVTSVSNFRRRRSRSSDTPVGRLVDQQKSRRPVADPEGSPAMSPIHFGYGLWSLSNEEKNL